MARNRRYPLLLALALAHPVHAQPPPDVTVVSDQGRRTIPVSEFSGQPMVPLGAILRAVGAETRSASESAVQVGVGGTVARLSDGMNFVPVGGRTVMLQSPPRRVSGEWFVPLDFLSRVLPSISPVEVTYRDRERMLILGAEFPRLEVSTSRDPAFTRIEIMTSRRVPIEITQPPETGEIRLTIQAPYLETAFRGEEVGDGVVERIGLERRAGHYELTVDLGMWFGRLNASEQRAPRNGLVLDLLRSNVPNARARSRDVDVIQEDLRSMVEREAAERAAREAAAAAAAGEEGETAGTGTATDTDTDIESGGEEDPESDIEFETIELPPDFGLTNPDPRRPDAGARNPSGPTELRIVAIDPGHGGTETGAEGASGLVEKDLVLRVSRQLKTLLQDRLGVRVILTRDGDRDLDLDERAAIANNNKADLFISIHADASPRRDARGSSVYFLSYSADGTARESVASAVSSARSGSGSGSDLDFILWELAQASHLNQSSQLAEIFQEELRAATNASGVNRGIKQNTFRVLKGATMPAVLVELGFISNPQEESLLSSEEHQQKLAEALYRGVVRFKDLFEYEPRADDRVSSRSRP